MTPELPSDGLQLRSLVKPTGELELSLLRVPIPDPGPDEVVVRIEAAPINPSDIGLLFGAADLSTAKVSGEGADAVVTASIFPRSMKGMTGRVGQSMPVGNEGAGVVVRAGSSPDAQALLGATVAVLGGSMFSEFRCLGVDQCMRLPAGTSAAEGASSFINPLTALGMVETMRREGHKALVHTAAASNLGQMLNRLCRHDGVALVNIVRSDTQAQLLRGQGATLVCNSTAPSFLEDLTEALFASGATLAFDATGGGKLAGQILACMEAAVSRGTKDFNRYGSMTHKQVYIYGGLEPGPTEFNRSFGMAWGMGGWLVFPFLQRIGPTATSALKERVIVELKTTFASHYSKEISLAEALQLDVIAAYGARATGSKYLINPSRNRVDGGGR